MNEKSERTPAERVVYTVYRVDESIFIPHYLNDNVYVGPGYGRKNTQAYSAAYLESIGATKETADLWIRGTFGRINNVKDVS